MAEEATNDAKSGGESVAADEKPTTATEPKAEPSGEAPAAAQPTPAETAPALPRVARPELTEEQINSPSRTALVPLYVVFAVTLMSWGAARFACNMHPPESRPPPKLSIDRLAATPKDAAIEAVQRWESHDYDGALQIAAGSAAAELEKARADCQAHANECARQREASAGLLTMAEVLRNDGSNADAHVTTLFKGQKKEFKVSLSRSGMLWKIVSRSPS
jgi:hypothetical protein